MWIKHAKLVSIPRRKKYKVHPPTGQLMETQNRRRRVQEENNYNDVLYLFKV